MTAIFIGSTECILSMRLLKTIAMAPLEFELWKMGAAAHADDGSALGGLKVLVREAELDLANGLAAGDAA